MAQPATLPRLTQTDMEDLYRVCGQLDAAAAVLIQSSWSGKFPVLTMLDQAKQTLSGLYNRGEATYIDLLKRRSAWALPARFRTGGRDAGLLVEQVAAPEASEG